MNVIYIPILFIIIVGLYFLILEIKNNKRKTIENKSIFKKEHFVKTKKLISKIIGFINKYNRKEKGLIIKYLSILVFFISILLSDLIINDPRGFIPNFDNATLFNFSIDFFYKNTKTGEIYLSYGDALESASGGFTLSGEWVDGGSLKTFGLRLGGLLLKHMLVLIFILFFYGLYLEKIPKRNADSDLAEENLDNGKDSKKI